jgi:hypothetical protein
MHHPSWNHRQIVGIARQWRRQFHMGLRLIPTALVEILEPAGLEIPKLFDLLRGQWRLHLRKCFGKNHGQLRFRLGRLLSVLAHEVLIKLPARDLVEQRLPRSAYFSFQGLELVALGLHKVPQRLPLVIG